MFAIIRTISIVWSVEDVQEVRPGLNNEQAMEVLQQVKNHHNASIGINWDTLKYWADELYLEQNAEG